MDIIVAGQRIVSESEFAEAAMGFGEFTPTKDDLQAFAEFVAEGYGPADQRNEIDAANDFYFRRRKPVARRRRAVQAASADVVPLPRSGAGLAPSRKGRAA
ncbi:MULTISPECIES: hypothetical protein [unclassified Streptomyces]|uniref:hypothetical protein n=1 Tax=unclassified Streptomyces TaxID=2593676 RepID=UPI0007F451AF|nr:MULTISPECIES: hypothetical protein [unclassified Streptomyces]AZM64966.1 hypothetical protein DLM49_36310 [Streptomyces sp. WAC 01438]AZM65012.1 hypothetical protein DLM49_36560 [Streptomyces sp. WAC 01438]RSM85863.1 hypothetical protein DMA10_36815 [Streptomyces sp. WAC 01420]SBT94016.1 hypothetical protein GA0115233_107650 [Streptomyces sp. DI166]